MPGGTAAANAGARTLAFGSSAEDHRKSSIESTSARIDSAPAGSFILGAFLGGTLAPRNRTRLDAQPHRFREAEPGLRQIMLTVSAEQVAAPGVYTSLSDSKCSGANRARYL
jgi:hypothetical protein